MEKTEEYLKLLNDFESKMVATLGTEGSTKGSTLKEPEWKFKSSRRDWAEKIDDFTTKLGFESIEELIKTIETVTLKDGIIYPVVNSENKDVFYLIDKTKKNPRRRCKKSDRNNGNYTQISSNNTPFSKSSYFNDQKQIIIRNNSKFSKSDSDLLNTMSQFRRPANNNNFRKNYDSKSFQQTTKKNFQAKKNFTSFKNNNKQTISLQQAPLRQVISASTTTEVYANLMTSVATNLPISSNKIAEKKLENCEDILISSTLNMRNYKAPLEIQSPSDSTKGLQAALTPSESLKDTSQAPKAKVAPSKFLLDLKERPKVFDIIDIIKSSSGGTTTLEQLKIEYRKRFNDDLTGNKLASILGVVSRNHTVAIQTFKPPIFLCTVGNTGITKIALDLEQLKLLDDAISASVSENHGASPTQLEKNSKLDNDELFPSTNAEIIDNTLKSSKLAVETNIEASTTQSLSKEMIEIMKFISKS